VPDSKQWAGFFPLAAFAFNKFARVNRKLPCSTRSGVTCPPYSRCRQAAQKPVPLKPLPGGQKPRPHRGGITHTTGQDRTRIPPRIRCGIWAANRVGKEKREPSATATFEAPHNLKMPFTLAHAAAALPFRRTKLIASAVVVGCFAPDFEYFIRLAPRGGFGHTLPGLFVFDLPLGLAVYWLFHRYAKEPLWTCLPEDARQRVKLGPSTSPFGGAVQSALVSLSILVGGATHILWDSFTHPSFWPYRHWHFLSDTVRLPIAGLVQNYKLLQHASTAFGLLVLLIWFLRLPRVAPTHPRLVRDRRVDERLVFLFASVVALTAGALRAFVGVGAASGVHRIQIFVGEAVVTTISVFWLELVIYGFLRERSSRSPTQTP
jgi:hypothetical protein